jgi:hypothetical protein
MDETLERQACTPVAVDPAGFNPAAVLPYGLTTVHIAAAMQSFTEFLGFINTQLHTRGLARLESMLMPANFSSIVGEYMTANLPRYCPSLVKNAHHNGHPDLLPAGRYPHDAAQHAAEGIEVKASRYLRGWQGHNAEAVWLLVFAFASNRPRDAAGTARPLRFLLVAGARLELADWRFAGRSATSRRTITASVAESGYQKMMANWIYRAPASPGER